MKADDMNKWSMVAAHHCSLVAVYHQMTNARSDRWHHFAGDPLFGKIAESNCRNAGQHHATREKRPRRTILSSSFMERFLRYLGWHRRN
jgi:hypothetical protein